MLDLARSVPGFVSYKAFEADDGERVSIIEFETDEALRAWREHPEHREAQVAGRDRFYAEYDIKVCSPLREYAFRAGTSNEPRGGVLYPQTVDDSGHPEGRERTVRPQ